jgi:hypothetical protein
MGGPLGVPKEEGWFYSRGKRQKKKKENKKMERYEVRRSNGNDIEAKRNEASIIRHFLYRSKTNKLILKL